MIVSIRGTHGAGKSVVVRRVKELYTSVVPSFEEGRKQPTRYACSGGGLVPLTIMGHYETPAGGCDTIKSMDKIFDPILAAASAGENVLFEGIVAQNSIHRLLEVNEICPVDVVVLTTPLEMAIDAVEDRRIAKGNYDPLNPENTIREFKSVISSTKRLREFGVRVHELDRESAFQWVVAALREPACAE